MRDGVGLACRVLSYLVCAAIKLGLGGDDNVLLATAGFADQLDALLASIVGFVDVQQLAMQPY